MRSWTDNPPEGLRGFRVCVCGSWRILARPSRLDPARAFLGPLPVESLMVALGDPRPPLDGDAAGDRPGGAPRGRGATLVVDCGDGTSLVLKALRRGGLAARLGGGYHGGSRLLAEMALLVEAASRGISTAPLAFGATGRREDGGEVALMATELIRDSIRLGKLIEGSAPPGPAAESPGRRKEDRRRESEAGVVEPDRRAGLRAAGAEAGRAHDLGLDHADLNIGNILLGRREGGGGWQAFIIDMGLSKLGGSLDAGRRAANLVRLLRSAEKHLGKDPRRLRDAASFLQGYLSGTADPGRRRRRELLAAIRRRLPAVVLHRLGWSLLGRS